MLHESTFLSLVRTGNPFFVFLMPAGRVHYTDEVFETWRPMIELGLSSASSLLLSFSVVWTLAGVVTPTSKRVAREI